MKFNYFDIHSHLNLAPLLENKDEIIKIMREKSIGTITVGVDYETSKIALELSKENPDILWATVGQHPNDNPEEEFIYDKYLELARDHKVVAIGECGLDYFRLKVTGDRLKYEEEKQRQKELFIQHVKLAVETGKPLMIHARPSVALAKEGSLQVNSMPAHNASDTAGVGGDAYNDVLDILENYNLTPKTSKLSANFHFFVGDIEIANRIIKNNWTMSFDGPVTFTNDYDQVIKHIPIENIMCETDAPFASPTPYRGQTNYPQYVEHIYKRIAEIKEIPLADFKNQMLINIKNTFNI